MRPEPTPPTPAEEKVLTDLVARYNGLGGRDQLDEFPMTWSEWNCIRSYCDRSYPLMRREQRIEYYFMGVRVRVVPSA
jgi:hypothetical protein